MAGERGFLGLDDPNLRMTGDRAYVAAVPKGPLESLAEKNAAYRQAHYSDSKGMMGSKPSDAQGPQMAQKPLAQRALTPDELKAWADAKMGEIQAQDQAYQPALGRERDAAGGQLPQWLTDTMKKDNDTDAGP